MRRPSLFLLFSGSPVHRLRRRRRRRPAWWAPFSIVTLLLSAVAGHATTVLAPSFSELVAESDLIARATVVDVSSRWVARPQGAVIKTFVTLQIEKRMKGPAQSTVTLEFLGGTVGQDSLRVTGMPEFKPGDTEIVFVRGNGTQVCPLARFGHGRYRVHLGTDQRRHVAKDDGSPLESTADVQRSMDDHGHRRPAAQAGEGLTSDEFESSIADEVARRAP